MNVLVSDAVQDYLDLVRSQVNTGSRRPRTLESAVQILWEFRKNLGERNLNTLTRRDLLDYLESLGRAGNSHRTLANKYIRIVAMLKHHDISLSKKGDMPRFVRKMPTVYERGLDAFFAACDDHQRLLFKTFLTTGLRMSEAKWLEWGDLQRGILIVQPHLPWFNPKTHEERRIPVPSELWRMLLSRVRRPGQLVFPTKSGNPDRKMLQACKRIATRAGLDERDWTLHGFRRTYCTTLLRSGMDVRTVMSLMGHANIETTLRYLRPIEAENLRCKVDSLFG